MTCNHYAHIARTSMTRQSISSGGYSIAPMVSRVYWSCIYVTVAALYVNKLTLGHGLLQTMAVGFLLLCFEKKK